jgi:hypothetical protein
VAATIWQWTAGTLYHFTSNPPPKKKEKKKGARLYLTRHVGVDTIMITRADDEWFENCHPKHRLAGRAQGKPKFDSLDPYSREKSLWARRHVNGNFVPGETETGDNGSLY